MSWKIWKKYSRMWRPHISYCLPNLTVSIGKTLIWHQEGKGVLYVSSATSEKFSIRSSLTAKLPTGSLMVNNRILKMPNIRTKKSTYWCFSYNYFIASTWISAYSRSRDVALLHHSWWDFPSHFSSYYLNSQLCILFPHSIHYFIFFHQY